MKLTGKTKAQIEQELADRELKELVDKAQEEAEQMLQDIIRSMAIDKLKEINI